MIFEGFAQRRTIVGCATTRGDAKRCVGTATHTQIVVAGTSLLLFPKCGDCVRELVDAPVVLVPGVFTVDASHRRKHTKGGR